MLQSIAKGHALISNDERKLWFAGTSSHFKKTRRVFQLYGVITQFSELPGQSVIFPAGQTGDELFRNRNTGIYVEYSHQDNEFKSPGEAVSRNYLTALPSFAKTILYYCKYGYIVDRIENTMRRQDRRHLSKAIQRVLKEKRTTVKTQIERLNEEHPEHPLDTSLESVFCCSPDWLLPLPTSTEFPFDKEDRSNFYIYYTVSMDSFRKNFWLMDNEVGVTVITKDGAIAHSTLEIPEEPGTFIDQRNQAFLDGAQEWMERSNKESDEYLD